MRIYAAMIAVALCAAGCWSTPKPKPSGERYPFPRFVDPVTEEVPDVRR